MDVINFTPIVRQSKNWLNSQSSDTALNSWRQPFYNNNSLHKYIVNNKSVKHHLPSKMVAGGNPSDVVKKGLLTIYVILQRPFGFEPRLLNLR